MSLPWTIIHKTDYSQIKNYIDFNKKNMVVNEINNFELFSNRIIYHIIKYFLSITKDHDLLINQQVYYLDWKSLLNDCYRESFSNKCKIGISRVLKEIEMRIME